MLAVSSSSSSSTGWPIAEHLIQLSTDPAAGRRGPADQLLRAGNVAFAGRRDQSSRTGDDRGGDLPGNHPDHPLGVDISRPPPSLCFIPSFSVG